MRRQTRLEEKLDDGLDHRLDDRLDNRSDYYKTDQIDQTDYIYQIYQDITFKKELAAWTGSKTCSEWPRYFKTWAWLVC